MQMNPVLVSHLLSLVGKPVIALLLNVVLELITIVGCQIKVNRFAGIFVTRGCIA